MLRPLSQAFSVAKPIRVLLLVPSLNGGGAERMALHLMNAADPAQFDIRIGLLRRSGAFMSQVPDSRGMAAIGERWLDPDIGNAKLYLPHRLLMAIAAAPLSVWSMMRSFRPHVMVTFRKGMAICATASAALYGRRRVRWIAREGNNTMAVIREEIRNPLSRLLIKKVTGYCFNSADRLVGISEGLSQTIARDFRTPQTKLHTIYNAVDIGYVQKKMTEPLPYDPGQPFLLAVGRLEPQKGHDVLIDAFARSTARHRMHLVIIGEGSARGTLQAQVDARGLGDCVHMPGFVDNPWAQMSRAQAFVLPSRWEGFGNVVIEAMACGAPAIVTDCDFGPREIVVHGESGLIVPTGDVDALCRAIDRVALDQELRLTLARQGAERVRSFDLPCVVRRYTDLFRELAQDLAESTS